MGGPVNKAAYVFGTGTLAATVFFKVVPVAMAAVMAGVNGATTCSLCRNSAL